MTVLELLGDDETDVMSVTVIGLGPIAYAELLEAHPPRVDVDEGRWNEHTFPPALIVACTGVSEDLAHDWWHGDGLTVDAAEELFAECLRTSAPGSIEWASRALDLQPRLALEMAYCGPRGIAHDVFLLWPRRSQDLALAQLKAALNHCPGCGVATELMDDPGAGTWRLRPCVHCESREQLLATVPDAERSRFHAQWLPGDLYEALEAATAEPGIG